MTQKLKYCDALDMLTLLTQQHSVTANQTQLFRFIVGHALMLCFDHHLCLWPQLVPHREHSVSLLQIPTT